MPLAVTAADINALAQKAARAIGYELSAVFWREANLPGAAPERSEAFRLIAFALGLSARLVASDSRRPFGDPASGHSPEQLTKEQAADLAEIAPAIDSPEVRAILRDIAWLRIRGNPDLARRAVADYLDSACILEDPTGWSEGMARAERAVRLSRSLGVDDPSFKLACDYLIELVRRHKGTDPLFLTGRTIELLLEFEIGDPIEFRDYAKSAAQRASAANNYYVARYYLDLLAKLHRCCNDEEAANAALNALAGTWEVEAALREASGDYLAAADFLTQAVQAYRRLPNGGASAEALRPRLQQAERASIAQFKKIQGPSVNIAEFVRAAREHVAGKPLRDALIRLAYITPFANPDEMRQSAIEMAKIAPLHHLLAMQKKDSEGRTVGIAPSVSPEASADDDEIFARVVEHMTWQRGFAVQAYIIPALQQITLEHAITFQELLGLSAYSPFVPQGREQIFAEGLRAGFHMDFMTAVHLLVPQIENSLRHLMQTRGIVTTKIDRYGIQRHLDLSDLLVDARLEAILSLNIILELRALLIDNRGPNFRHQLAHGMLDANAFGTAEAVYAWWLTLALCIFGSLVKAPPSPQET
jgi:hypothetical protein